jgi:hypothetical protein
VEITGSQDCAIRGNGANCHAEEPALHLAILIFLPEGKNTQQSLLYQLARKQQCPNTQLLWFYKQKVYSWIFWHTWTCALHLSLALSSLLRCTGVCPGSHFTLPDSTADMLLHTIPAVLLSNVQQLLWHPPRRYLFELMYDCFYKSIIWLNVVRIKILTWWMLGLMTTMCGTPILASSRMDIWSKQKCTHHVSQPSIISGHCSHKWISVHMQWYKKKSSSEIHCMLLVTYENQVFLTCKVDYIQYFNFFWWLKW